MIPAAGKAYFADQLGPRTLPPIADIAIGTGTPGATALGSEVSRRSAKVISAAGGAVTYEADWALDDEVAATITEAALFAGPNATSVMVASAKNLNISKGKYDPLALTWILKFY